MFNPIRISAVSGLLVVGFGCKAGSPPRIVGFEDPIAVVGETLVIEIEATDPDGDSLTYGFKTIAPDLGSSAAISTRPDGGGSFSWTPSAKHLGKWTFDFTASDGRHTSTYAATLDVRSAFGEGSEPVFVEPIGAGATLEFGEQDCTELDVLVEDVDTSSITLTQEPPVLAGAQLDVTENGREGTWRWCPRKDELDFDHAEVTLVADDGDNPPTRKSFVVAVRGRTPGSSNCAGKGPRIEHTPVEHNGVLDLEIVAEIRDDAGVFDEPLVHIGVGVPPDPVDLSRMETIAMEEVAGDAQSGVWRAHVENPLAKEGGGEAAVLYYVISAGAGDVAAPEDSDECSRLSYSPATGAHRIGAVLSDGGGDAEGDVEESTLKPCAKCSADAQCGEKDDLCLREAGTTTGVCGKDCEGGCSDDYTCSKVELASIEGAKAKQCIPEAGACRAGEAKEDSESATTQCSADPGAVAFTMEQATPLREGEKRGARLCAPARAKGRQWYEVKISTPVRLVATVTADDRDDLDLGLVDSDGKQIRVRNGLSTSETLATCVLPGTYYLRIVGKTKPQGVGFSVRYTTEDDAKCKASASTSGSDAGCCNDRLTPGCDDATVRDCVCAEDAFCCAEAWDATCVAEVHALGCGQCGGMEAECCEFSELPGCADGMVEACVCNQDDYCCAAQGQWDDLCVSNVDLFGCGECGGVAWGTGTSTGGGYDGTSTGGWWSGTSTTGDNWGSSTTW